MVSFSNGNLSGEVPHKRPLGNGFTPKFKPRKVSAIRDFPPGCGPNAVPVNLKLQENGVGETGKDHHGAKNPEISNAVVVKGIQSSEKADLMESEAVGKSEVANKTKSNGVETAEMQTAEGSGVKNSTVEVECQPHEAVNSNLTVDMTESLVASVEKVLANANGIQKLIKETRPRGIQLPNEVERHGHEAIDNPVEVEIAESLDALVGKVTTTILGSSSSNVAELVTGSEPVRVDAQNDKKNSSCENTEAGDQMLKHLNEVDVSAVVPNPGLGEAKPKLSAGSIRPKDKYRVRRVSAVRDFPPNCGTNVPLPIEEEKQMVISGNGADKVEVEANATHDMVADSQTECLEQLDNNHVQNGTTEILNDASGTGQLGVVLEATVEGGLVDSENCGRSQKHSTFEKMEAKPAVDTIIEDTRGSMEKEIVVRAAETIDEVMSPHVGHSIGNVSPREIVHGLMATKYCPWRKSKVTSNNSDCRTSAHKDCVQKLSRQQNSKAVVTSDNTFNADSSERNPPNGNSDSYGANESPYPLTVVDGEDRGACEEYGYEITPISMFKLDDTENESAEPVGKEIVVYSQGESDEMRPAPGVFSPDDEEDREDVHGVMAAPNCSSSKGNNTVSSKPDGEVSGDRERKKKLSLTGLSNSDSGTDAERMKEENLSLTILNYSDRATSGAKKKKKILSCRKKAKAVAKKSIPNPKVNSSGSPSKKRQKKVPIFHDHDGDIPTNSPSSEGRRELEVSLPPFIPNPKVNTSRLPPKKRHKKTPVFHDRYGDISTNSSSSQGLQELEVSLPPFGPKSSDNGDARHKVRETLRLFNALCRKLLQKEEANSRQEDEPKSNQSKLKPNRIDLLAAKAIKDQGKEVNTTSEFIIGQVPGVEVGDEFQYRVELAVVGIHRLYQGGIDGVNYNGKKIAVSIVASGGYDDDTENADVLYYSGAGGIGKDKEPEDQKLERGNLALYNSISEQTPVRVVRGWKETRTLDPLDRKPKIVMTYIYDGLYTVKGCETKMGPHGKKVFMFELRRNPGQPELAWKELKRTSLSKFRPGMRVADISNGEEQFPICAVNTLNDEKPPQFNYVSKMKYPNWFNPVAPPGCDCTTRCSDSKKCKCAVKNGGEIPYNRNGAIVETKPLVYECGPHCKCPPSCYNRVTQRGIRFKLEIFKTESRGWGVRALTSIPSGSFICEYAGELLQDKEAEEKIGNDEYLFDIGLNYSDCYVKAEDQAVSAELMEEGGYTIDAAHFGNIGRFINHSCAPNLYAQNVLYDHDDKKMPHVMLFAVENIPPLQELTYHYNYSVDQIFDSHGNVKVKKCYCGTAECTGRMY